MLHRAAVVLSLSFLMSIPACAEAAEPGARGTDAGQAAPETDPLALPVVDLEPAYSKIRMTRPVYMTHDGAHEDRLYVVEQPGRVIVFDRRDDVSTFDILLDVSDSTFDQHNEEGLLGLAFHPKFAENGRFYVYQSMNSPRRSEIAEYRLDPENDRRADPASRRKILSVEQPWGNHNGGMILFGPDGYLYASLGDGGFANDPKKAGQDLGTMLGSIIRIDVDPADASAPYGVPADNPFVGRDGARGEIWAYGLRNVWRMSFDQETGDLWAGDVGQNSQEEVDLITRGANYGWNLREGTLEFAKGTADVPLIEPLAVYERRKGISITGGYVYRGTKQPALDGVYLYADYFSGRIWGLRYADGAVAANSEMFKRRTRPNITSFGEDQDGELFVCVFDQMDKRGTRGRLYRVVTR